MDKISILNIAQAMDYVGLKKTAEFLRACRRIGSEYPRAREDEIGISDTLRGLTYIATNPISRTRAIDAVQMVAKFKNGNEYEEWLKRSKWQAPEIIANLIADSPLKYEKLKVLDIGCHFGNQLYALLQHNDLKRNIKRFIGIDLSGHVLSVAKERFACTNGTECTFIEGNALDQETYENIPRDNNLIICSGVCDYLSPKEIKKLLLCSVNKFSSEGRMYFSYLTVDPIYNSAIKDDDRFNLQGIKRKEQCSEDGILFYIFNARDKKGRVYYCYAYEPQEFRKIVEQSGLEIDVSNSFSNPQGNFYLKEHDHVCLKKK